MNIELSVTNVTPQNKQIKMLKAVRVLSQHLGVPVSVDRRNHGPEPFFYKAQEELNYKWYNYFSVALKETYLFVIKYFGLPEMNIVLKKASPEELLTHKGKVLYSPETGEPINKADWDRFVELLEKFLNKRLKDTDKKIVLNSKALGRILNRMLKYNTLEAVKELSLDDVKYRGKTLDWISDSVKNMQSAFGEELSRGEMARIQVLQMSAAERITKTTEAVKSDIRQILIDGVKGRKGKGQVSQAIFDRMTGANRDFQRIADTEIQNASNNSFLLDEASRAEPGEKVYFQRIERIDDNTCKFCKEMHGVVVLWSDHPLPDKDRIDDPIAKYAIWDGKDWDGKKEMVANGVFHPYCRGVWVRYNGAEINALVAEIQGKSKEFNEALAKTKSKFKEKGIDNPTDKTPGFTESLFDDFTLELVDPYMQYGELKMVKKSLIEKFIKKAFSQENYKKYFPAFFDPVDRGGGWARRSERADGWLTSPNPDDYDSALWAVMQKYLKKHYPQLNDKEREEIAHIISNSFWSGNSRGFENAKNIDKSLTFSGYKLQDRYRFAGLEISVENKKGSTRSGTDKDGHKWSVKMYYDYGYIRGSVGVDKDHVDVYVGDNEEAPEVYIVHQNDPVTKKYDEDKVMLGFSSLHEARRAYLKQYDRPGFLGSIDVIPLEEFKDKVLSKNYRGKMIKSVSKRVSEILEGVI